MIHLDTCVLVDALTGPRRSAAALRGLIEQGERIAFSALVLYEWRRGPRHADELRIQEALFPADGAVPFGRADATLASDLYRQVTRPRGRELDLGDCGVSDVAGRSALDAERPRLRGHSRPAPAGRAVEPALTFAPTPPESD